ncbi:oxygenase MpaB family protein [Nocardia neocaledoniensis]|uniref:oxygenase MpaB family protein n=1 Tax=Nocardia neocaledoniensis TaxID=236511 RepID=UPI00340F6CA0
MTLPRAALERPAAGALLRRHLGDRRFLLTLPRAVGLQVLHPAIAPALAEHTTTRLWEHKKRAVLQMIHLACGAHDTAAAIRFAHEHVKGTDDRGTRYHALYPDTFLFQHATYVEALMTAADLFGPALTAETRTELYTQCCRWYRSYGITDRGLPATWPDFTEYFTDACAGALRMTPAAATLGPQVLRPDAWVVRRLPSAAVRAMQHPRAVELYRLTPRAGDAVALRTVVAFTRAGAAAVPRWRSVPQARH